MELVCGILVVALLATLFACAWLGARLGELEAEVRRRDVAWWNRFLEFRRKVLASAGEPDEPDAEGDFREGRPDVIPLAAFRLRREGPCTR